MQPVGSVASFRKLTPAMVASQKLAMANDIVKTTKSEVAMALKKAAPALGVDGTTYHILDILIGLTAAEDWSQNRRPLVAISNEKLAEYVCRSTRTVVRSLRKLVEAGVLAYKDSPTGRRFIYRAGEDRQIQRGYGLDFSPARQRVVELKKLGAEFAARLAKEKEAKRTVSRLSRAIEDLLRLAAYEQVDVEEITDAVGLLNDQAMGIADRAEAMTMLHELLVSKFDSPDMEHEGGSEVQPEYVVFSKQNEEMSCAQDIDVIPYNNTTNQDSWIKSKQPLNVSHDPYSKTRKSNSARFKDALEQNRKSEISARPTDSTQLDPSDWIEHEGPHEKDQFSPLFSEVSLGLLTGATPETQGALGLELNSWATLIDAADDLRLLIGLSPKGWFDAQARVGDYVAAAVLITTVEKALRNPESIARPAGYFRACIDRAVDGKLALHRTLFGLSSSSSLRTEN
ncbi:plasmid replication protein RepC [Pseudovibrio sp. Tun.PSC04-5.I4]|uniref:plasmid replication protein RepC n=1 Tax=Pseudovibrio sp. Tun.PSC04-5.I4 TaxID=1798213 RepID=UPI000888E2BA|nr:plasmid replication protein RepC [Pseudovibrio sp. Tun.PSC04-5.I4]SDQ18307.1 replication initiation protein RepC [Pseudovibrio sp. Tun.PSC04-5.I4]